MKFELPEILITIIVLMLVGGLVYGGYVLNEEYNKMITGYENTISEGKQQMRNRDHSIATRDRKIEYLKHKDKIEDEQIGVMTELWRELGDQQR